MTLKHTINITVANFNLLYKAFFYFLIIAIIIGAIGCVAIAPTVNDIKASLDESGFSVSFKEVFEKLLDGDKAFLDSIKKCVFWFRILIVDFYQCRLEYFDSIAAGGCGKTGDIGGPAHAGHIHDPKRFVAFRVLAFDRYNVHDSQK